MTIYIHKEGYEQSDLLTSQVIINKLQRAAIHHFGEITIYVNRHDNNHAVPMAVEMVPRNPHTVGMDDIWIPT